jgi:hypothetical protein
MVGCVCLILSYFFYGLCSFIVVRVKPNAFLQGHDGPAYDVKFYGNAEEDALLLRFFFFCNILI